ncbi:AI-2E family transporter [Aureibaculum luteum]|uniref:AI-2E family transporter n=1 Tax=Aureibaculum luteum TaxID=1548456 RepID=UPI000E4A1E22|nr:AI-2E family transporter [Aureibaculum luteum]
MNSKIIANGILRAIAVVLGVALLLYFLYMIQSVIVYIIIAAVLSLIARPVIFFLRKRLKFPNTLAVIVTMILFMGLIFGLISMFIPLINQQGENLSLLKLDNLESTIEQLLVQVNTYFSEIGINIFEQLESADIFKNFKAVPYLLNTVVSTVGSISVGLFSVLFITFFLMKDSRILNKGLLTLVPKGKESRFQKSIEKIKDLLSRYFLGLLLQILILFILYTIILVIFGIENAIVIAFLCALLNLIPYIGPLIAGVLMAILTMNSDVTLDFRTEILPTTIYVMIGYFIAQMVDNFFSQPKIFSEATKAHPLEIFLVIIIGGLLFGVMGMIVAVPGYTAIKVILKEFLSDNKIVKSLTKDI